MTVKSDERVWYHGAMCHRVRYEGGSVGLYVEGCSYCDREKEQGNPHFPSHWASDYCKSGKYPHCTCDSCW